MLLSFCTIFFLILRCIIYTQVNTHNALTKPLLRSLPATKNYCCHCYVESINFFLWNSCLFGTSFLTTPYATKAEDNTGITVKTLAIKGKERPTVRKLFFMALHHFFSIKPVKQRSLYFSLPQEYESRVVGSNMLFYLFVTNELSITYIRNVF